MVRYAVGYQSRAFVTFGKPIPLERLRPGIAPRRDGRSRTRSATPSACSTRCCRRPSSPPRCGRRSTRRELEGARRRDHRDACAPSDANLAVTTGREAVEEGARAAGRPQHHPRRARRTLSASASAPCCATTRARSSTCSRFRGAPSERTDASGYVSKAFFHALAGSQSLKHLASRYGMRRPTSFARRFIAGETVEEAIDAARADRGRRPDADARSISARASRRSPRRTPRRAPTSRCIERIVAAGHRAQHLAEAHAARAHDRSRDVRRQPAPHPRRAPARTTSSSASTWRTRRSPQVTLDVFETMWQQGYRNAGVVLQSYLPRSEADAARMNALGARVRLVKGAYKEPKDVAYQAQGGRRRGVRRAS